MRRTLFAAALLSASGALDAAPAAAQTVGAKTLIDAGRSPFSPCNETTMAASEANPLEIVAGWNDYRLGGGAKLGIGLSLDGGATWTDQILRPPPAFQSGTEGDPMTAADPRTGALWVGAISFDSNGGVFVARKDFGQTGFEPVVMAEVTPSADKCWMAAGPDPSDPDLTRVYIAYNEGLLRSTDMGDTWTGPTPLASGLGFLPRVGPNGELYVAYWNFAFSQMLLRSFNGGVSFDLPAVAATRMDTWGIDASRVPGNARVVPIHGFAVDPNDGTLYYVYHDTTDIQSNGANLDVYFTKSTDQALNWTTPVAINSDSLLPQDQFFPWIEVDRTSRLHMVFYSGAGFTQSDTDSLGRFHAIYATSDDGGATWTETPLATSPLDTVAAFPGGNFIGDYLGMATAGLRTLPLYIDTDAGDSDVFTQEIVHATGTTFCAGISCPCGNDGAGLNGEGCANTGGTGVRLDATGSTALNDVVLLGSGFPAVGAPTVVAIRSTAQEGGGLGTANGDGLLCIAPPVVRMASGVALGGSVSVPIGHGAGAGTFHYQLWYRSQPQSFCDPAAAYNFSNGLTLIWP